jgi:acyl carrier protein
VGVDDKNAIRAYIVTTWLSGDERGLNDETDLHQLGVLDSFSTLSLIAFLEGTFKVQIEPSEINAESLRSIEAIAALVQRKSEK